MAAIIRTPDTDALPAISSAPFFRESDPSGFVNEYHSITSLNEHLGISFEELRLKNYAHGQGVLVPTSTSSAFSPPSGLVTASIPCLCTQCQVPCVSKASTVRGSNPFSSRVITFRVAKERSRDFIIHESLIAARSEFVRTALQKDWKEAKEGVVPLPEDDIDSFDLYQQWIYTGGIFLNRFATATDTQNEYELLVRAYLLGEKLIDLDFKDTVIDCIIHKLRASRTFDARLTNLIYENTPPESPLRRLWLDIYFYSGSPNWLDEKALGDFIHPEFAVDLSKTQMGFMQRFKSVHAPFMGNSCVYHEHAGGHCYQEKCWFN